MPYTLTVWKDRLVQNPRRFKKTAETSTSVTLEQDPGVVTEVGTPITATLLNKMEKGIQAAHDEKLDNSHAKEIELAHRDYKSASVTAAGWYRVAELLGSSGRGDYNFAVYTPGGDYAVQTIAINVHTNNSAGSNHSLEAYCPGGTYWTGVRIAADGTRKFLEVYFMQALNAFGIERREALGYPSPAEIYGGALTASPNVGVQVTLSNISRGRYLVNSNGDAVTASEVLQSTVAPGKPPLAVASPTMVPGMNVELHNGWKQYSSVEAMGLTASADMQAVVNAMAVLSKATLIVTASNNTIFGLTASDLGVISAEKLSTGRASAIFTGTNGQIKNAIFSSTNVYGGWKSAGLADGTLQTNLNSERTNGIKMFNSLTTPVGGSNGDLWFPPPS